MNDIETMSPEDAKAEIASMRNDASNALNDGAVMFGKSEALDRLTKLHERAYGTDAAVDESGQSMDFHDRIADAMDPAQDPSAYDFEPLRNSIPPDVEWDGEFEADARTWLFRAGVSAVEGTALANRYGQIRQMTPEQQDAMADDAEETLKRVWGADFSENLNMANRTIRELGPKFRDFLDRTGLVNDHVTAMTLCRIGRARGL